MEEAVDLSKADCGMDDEWMNIEYETKVRFRRAVCGCCRCLYRSVYSQSPK
jgi:hypothetical protein